MNLLEAAYLVESGRLVVRRSKKGKEMGLLDLIEGGLKDNGRFMEAYLVFRDVRNRGIIALGEGEGAFLRYPRGKRPGSSPADSWISVYREHDEVSPRGLWHEAKRRAGMRMGFLCALVDADWDITYYDISPYGHSDPKLQARRRRAQKTSKTTLREMEGGGALLWDPSLKDELSGSGIGVPLGDGLLLSREERQALSVTPDAASEPDMDRTKLSVYKNMIGKGWMVKTGFKYGTHFRVYTQGSMEHHSDLLVHCMLPDAGLTWDELARAIRLSHSVRKRFLMAIPLDERRGGKGGDSPPVYLELAWTKL